MLLRNMPLRGADYWILVVASMEQMIGAALATVISVMLPMIALVGNPHMGAGLQGLVGAMGLIGIGIGGLAVGSIIDRFGYLFMFRLCPVLIMAGSAIVYFFSGLGALIAGLLIAGFGVGGGYSLDSSYISELMPEKWRNTMVGIAKASCAVGFIIPAVICYFMLKANPNPASWQSMMLVTGALGLIALLMRLRWAESPKWLLARGEDAKAQAAVQKLLGQGITIEPEPQETAKAEPEKFSWRQNWQRIVFSGIPWACEGLGVYGFSVFLPVLVMALGLSFDSASTHGIAKVMGSVEVSAAVNCFILVGFVIGLAVLGRFNHVRMLWWGFVASAAGLLLLLACYLLHWPAWVMMVGFVVYEIALNAGPHLITFIIPTSVYPVAIRGKGTGIADIMGKAGAVAGVILMPILLHWGGITLVLIVSAAVMLFGGLVGLVFGRRLGLV